MTSTRLRALLLTAAFLLPRLLAAQTAPGPMVARFEAGQSSRYEFEGRFRIVTSHPDNVRINFPDDCSYNLSAVLRFEFAKPADGDSGSGQVHFDGVKLSGFACGANPEVLTQALQKLQSTPVAFRLGPDGEAHLDPVDYTGPDYEGVFLLLKSAWDLLQTRLSDAALSPAPDWIATRLFLYWPDTFEDGLDVAAASMQYTRDVSLAGGNLALLKYKQVFSPAEVAAYIQVRTDARDFTGTTVIAGKNSVQLLFDPVHHHVVYLRRERSVDNRTTMKYDKQSSANPVAASTVVESSALRWIPEQNSEAWLAELHNFESTPEPAETETTEAASTGGASMAQLAEAARRKRASAPQNAQFEEVDLIHRAPKGFERWSRTECNGVLCFEISLAVPEGTRQAQSTSTTALLLGSFGSQTVTIGVGPVLDRQFFGLTDDQLLEKQTAIFLSNYLWAGGGEGRKINFSSSTLDDRPAALVDFSARSRDLTAMRGKLVMVLSSFNRLVPVTCSYSAPQRPELDAVCDTVSSSLITR